jgi:predicted molibdopterin-dependent oxidoreductase YjgC
LLEAARTDPTAIDRHFIDGYTTGFEAYRALVEAVPWNELEKQSGVPQAQIRALGEVYRQSQSAIISWCLGVTQQEHAVDFDLPAAGYEMVSVRRNDMEVMTVVSKFDRRGHSANLDRH